MARARKIETVVDREPTDPGSAAFHCADDRYFRWTTAQVTVRDRDLAVLSKPGVPAFDQLDPAEGLLLDHMEVAGTDTICSYHCGSGVVGALAALRAPRGQVVLSDDNQLSVEAARRTLAANAVNHAEARFCVNSEQPPIQNADVVALRIPKGKVPTLQLIWAAFHALRPGGRCYLAGGTDEGIKSALKHMEQLFGGAVVVGYRGGHRLGIATRPDGPARTTGPFDTPWLDPNHFHSYSVDAHGITFEAFTRPGVFSWERLDTGTAALLDVLEVRGHARILDLGCGAGVVGVAAALQALDAQVTMLDVNAEAIRSSHRTVAENGVQDRCEVRASDVAYGVSERRFDLVVTNPPFHIDRATDLDVPAQFIRDAARVLAPGGKLYVVANRTLPYEAWLDACFGAHRSERAGRQFKVLSAVRPAD